MKTPKTSKMMAALMALFGLAASCKAVDYHVVTAQDLQNALTLAAANGASNNIYITNGYYTGNFNFNSSKVNELTLLAEPGVSNTQIVIDSGGTGSSLNIYATASPNVSVQGMTFLRNCGSTSIGGLRIAGGNTAILVNGCNFLSPSNSSGIGLLMTSDLNAIVTNCTAVGSQSGGGGAGISISAGGNVTVQNCTMTSNIDGGLIASADGVVAVTGSLFTGNSATENEYTSYGGGADCSGTTVTLSGNAFIGNTANGYEVFGAGAACFGSNVTVCGNSFTSNVAGNFAPEGGGLYCQGLPDGSSVYPATIKVTANTFTGNSAIGAAGGPGGGVACSGTTVVVSGNTFAGNSANGGGGGSCCSGTTVTLSANSFLGNSALYYGGGSYCSGDTTLLLSNNTFTGNSVTLGGGGYAYGGGAYCFSSGNSAITASGNTFQQNSAAYGGGLYASEPVVNLLDNLVVNNGVSSQGGGIWVDASATLNMINNTVTGNTSPGSGGGVAYIVTGTVELLNIYNNIIWGNSATVTGGDVYLSGTGQKKVFDYNDADSIYGVFDIAQTNIDLSPQFFNPVSGDYHTQSTSPCIAAGDTNAPSLPATDLDGSPRIINGLVDMGCYEFTTNVFHPADLTGSWVISPSEFTAYAAAWKSGLAWTNAPNPIPANYLTRAGYLMTNGGAYYNDGSARPVNWKTNQ